MAVEPAPNDTALQSGVSQAGDTTGKPEHLPKASALYLVWSAKPCCGLPPRYGIHRACGQRGSGHEKGGVLQNRKRLGPARDLPAGKCKAVTAAHESHLNN